MENSSALISSTTSIYRTHYQHIFLLGTLFWICVSIYFFIYWTIVDLWYVSFRCTAKKSFCYIYIYLFPFQILFPFRLLREYWPNFPVLYNKSLLVIYFKYNNLYMSTPNSQFIPPHHPFPFITRNLYSMSVSLFIFL